MDLENNFDNEKQDINKFINFFIQITFFLLYCNDL